VGAIIRRAVVPALLIIVGVAGLVEGVLYHPIAVLVEKETKKTIDVPLPAQPAFPRGMGFARPTVIKQTVTLTELVAMVISEPDATRDVTVGGLVRIGSGEHAGELQRTYSGDKGPALCPT
jgi:hypothetical protein